MNELQAAKQLVQSFHHALDHARPDQIGAIFDRFTMPNSVWRGVHPFGIQNDSQSVSEQFWQPLRSAFSNLQRREDVFFSGTNEIDHHRSIWVVSMGHLMGLFDHTWLGIRPTNRIAMLRYCTFYKVADERITETVMHVDIPHLMVQAGQNPFPPETGVHLIHPGPRMHDGLLNDPQPAKEAEITLAVINSMIANLGQWASGVPLEEELARDWRDDMIWWGPAGIGSSFTIERYAMQHSGPFRAGLKNRSGTGHIARLAEGCFGGFFGWPNFTAEPTGGFMGMPATGKSGEFRVIDIYRREGDKLAENWVFIDLLHFWKQMGVDFLERAQRIE